ncbi:YjfB family protein [Chitinimonas sp.]|uniref:YjfB family protein n=1 Tax=Chitinimonas sp. TaxID=1934313 RepID=UPI0035B3685B
MEISGFVNAVSNAAAGEIGSNVAMFALRKALDQQQQSALTLLQAIPQASNPPHLGNAVDVRA